MVGREGARLHENLNAKIYDTLCGQTGEKETIAIGIFIPIWTGQIS